MQIELNENFLQVACIIMRTNWRLAWRARKLKMAGEMEMPCSRLAKLAVSYGYRCRRNAGG